MGSELDFELNVAAILLGAAQGHLVIPLAKLLLHREIRSDTGDLGDLAGLDTLVALLLADAAEDGLAVTVNGNFLESVGTAVAATLNPLLVHGLDSLFGDEIVVGDLGEGHGPGRFKLVEPQGIPAIQRTHIAGVLGVLTEPDHIAVGVDSITVGALGLHHQGIEDTVLLEDNLANLTLGTSHAGQVNDVSLADQLRSLVREELVELLSSGVGVYPCVIFNLQAYHTLLKCKSKVVILQRIVPNFKGNTTKWCGFNLEIYPKSWIFEKIQEIYKNRKIFQGSSRTS